MQGSYFLLKPGLKNVPRHMIITSDQGHGAGKKRLMILDYKLACLFLPCLSPLKANGNHLNPDHHGANKKV
jgi:hypothetical protein